MPLKFKFKSKEEIPPEHLPFYIERDGAFVLDAEGAVEKSKLDEFRQNNVALTKERDELKTRFEGIDPDEVRKLLDEKQKLELQAHGQKPEELERIVADRIKTLRGELETQVSGLTSERDALHARLVEIEINQGVIVAATKRGLRPSAIPDAVARARKVFQLVNGVPAGFEADGKTIRSMKHSWKAPLKTFGLFASSSFIGSCRMEPPASARSRPNWWMNRGFRSISERLLGLPLFRSSSAVLS